MVQNLASTSQNLLLEMQECGRKYAPHLVDVNLTFSNTRCMSMQLQPRSLATH